jgi:hypothetical protein
MQLDYFFTATTETATTETESTTEATTTTEAIFIQHVLPS